MTFLPTRQVHLDFHTSEAIPGVGSAFDPDDFARAFKEAHVESVTLFARCHHGWCYYDTEVGSRHPTLDFDLLRAQVDALQGVGIATPIYITCAWDELSAREHPEWRVLSPEGRFLYAGGVEGNPDGTRWALLDFSTGYMDFLERQIEEVAKRFPDAPGIFLDICHQYPSCSPAALRQMEKMGLDWTDPEHRMRHAAAVKIEYLERTRDAARSHSPKMRVFHNHGNVAMGDRSILEYDSHLEIESLPTGGWGYDHFPLAAKYAEEIGAERIGMTGKFHTLWGEFGGFKTPDALRYECGAMLAFGAGCSVGDHLHPSGAIAPSTLRLIGAAFEEVAQKESWCLDTQNVAEIGLLSARAVNISDAMSWEDRAVHNDADEGASRVLLEEGLLFDVLDRESDFGRYRMIILPDELRIDAGLAAKLESYRRAGGHILSTGASGFDPETLVPWADIGAVVEGKSPYDFDYVHFDSALFPEWLDDPVYLYEPSWRLRVTDGTGLGGIHDPYFNRRPHKFNGHANTPYLLEGSEWAAVVEKDGLIQCAHALFSIYHRHGAVIIRQVLAALIRRGLDDRVRVETTLPEGGRVSLRRGEGRHILHLLHATPQLRGRFRGTPVEVISELQTLKAIDVEMAMDTEVSSVRLVPTDQSLPYELSDGRLRFTVPQMRGHQMIEIS